MYLLLSQRSLECRSLNKLNVFCADAVLENTGSQTRPRTRHKHVSDHLYMSSSGGRVNTKGAENRFPHSLQLNVAGFGAAAFLEQMSLRCFRLHLKVNSFPHKLQMYF